MASLKLPLLPLLCSLAASSGCGEALVGNSYRGPLLAEQSLSVSFTRDLPARTMRVGIFWAPEGLQDRQTDGWIEHQRTTRTAEFPSSHVMRVFDPPVPEALGGRDWAVARLLLYLDSNGDGLRTPDEAIFGDARTSAVLFAERALPAADSPTGRRLPAGMHFVRRPLPCAPPPATGAERDCDVPLGQPCEGSGASCNDGFCFDGEASPTLPSSVCALRQNDSCRPAGGALVPHAENQAALWFQGCQDSSQCPSHAPRCDLATGACLLDFVATIKPQPDAVVRELCNVRPLP